MEPILYQILYRLLRHDICPTKSIVGVRDRLHFRIRRIMQIGSSYPPELGAQPAAGLVIVDRIYLGPVEVDVVVHRTEGIVSG